MIFLNRLGCLASSFLIVSCSTTPTPTEPDKNLSNPPQAESPSNGSITNTDSKSGVTKDNQKNVLSYFYEIYPKGSGKPVNGLNFEEKDIKNGYLRATGEMEGYFVFTLFLGDKADWIIEQSTGCGPECDQKFQVYKFENGKLVSKKSFENLYPKKKVDTHVAGLIKKLPKGPTNENLQSWVRLPQSGTSIDILIVDQNPGHTTGNVSVYQAGKLDWNGSGFKFTAMNPNKPSQINISSVR